MSSGHKKILAVNLYSTSPPIHGGKLAIWGLYKNLARWFNVEIVDFSNVHNIGTREISDYLLSTCLSKYEWKKMYDEFKKSELGNTVDDPSILVSREYNKDKYVTDGIKKAAENAEIIITEHPYTYRIIKSACPDKTIWYRAHNVEFNYKTSVYDKLSNKDALLREITEIERECCDGSELILTATENDYNDFQSIYGIDSSKLLNISSGYEWEACDFILPGRRIAEKNGYKATAFFISGNHEPGIKAAKSIIEIAKKLDSMMFVIGGTVSRGLDNTEIPKNVEILGYINNILKERLLTTCDIALNPTEHGSGLNIKMLEYFAFGIPVITTEFGARGLNISNSKEAVIVDYNNFGKAIEEFYNQSIVYKDNLANNAREYLINNFTWRNNAKKIVDYIKHNRIFEFNDSERSLVQVRKPVNMYNDEKYMKHILTRMDNQQILLWGTGEEGKRCTILLESFGKKCCGFIDNNPNKWGEEFQGYPIIPPKEYVEKYSDAIIIIASMYVYEIYKQLRELGCKRENILTSTWNLLNEEVDLVRVM